jgi:hypothetical protein
LVGDRDCTFEGGKRERGKRERDMLDTYGRRKGLKEERERERETKTTYLIMVLWRALACAAIPTRLSGDSAAYIRVKRCNVVRHRQ